MLQTKKAWESESLGESSSESVDVSLLSTAVSKNSSATPSVRTWGEAWLSRREREGVRSVSDERIIWRVHVSGEDWFDLLLSQVTKEAARDWFTRLSEKSSSNHRKSKKRLAAQTVKNILQVVRKAFAEAQEAGLLESNPFDGLRLRRGRTARDDEPWTVLRPEEQRKVASILPHPESLFFLFSLGTGLRQSEQWALRLEDVHLDAEPWIFVRRGTFRGPTKGGRPRRIALFGIALDALGEWLRILSMFAPSNPHALLFPRPDGTMRPKGRPF